MADSPDTAVDTPGSAASTRARMGKMRIGVLEQHRNRTTSLIDYSCEAERCVTPFLVTEVWVERV